MVTLNARNLSLGDVHHLLGIEPRYNGSFEEHLTLAPLTTSEQQALTEIQTDLRTYWAAGKISEGQVQFISVAPLLRLAGFYRSQIRLELEEDIARLYIADEETYITGRLDIVAVRRSDTVMSQAPFWILIIESKNSEASESTGLPQLLSYAFSSLERQDSVWGLVTNGINYQFYRLQQGTPPTYQLMPGLNLLEDRRAIELMQVLKAIGKTMSNEE